MFWPGQTRPVFYVASRGGPAGISTRPVLSSPVSCRALTQAACQWVRGYSRPRRDPPLAPAFPSPSPGPVGGSPSLPPWGLWPQQGVPGAGWAAPSRAPGRLHVGWGWLPIRMEGFAERACSWALRTSFFKNASGPSGGAWILLASCGIFPFGARTL